MMKKMKKHEKRSLKSNVSIDFKPVRKEPNLLEMAYLYEILTDSFGLSKNLREDFKKEFPFRDDNSWHCDEDLATIAVNSNIFAFPFLSKRLQGDKEFVTKIITAKKENQWLYNYLNDELKADIEIVKLCIGSDSSIIRNIAPVSDRELMEVALKDNVLNLEYASDDLKADKELVLGLAGEDWTVLRHMSKDLLFDSAFIAEAISCFNKNLVDIEEEDNEDLESFLGYSDEIDLHKVIEYLVSFYPHVLKLIAPVDDMCIICKCLAYTSEEDIPFILDCISDDLKKDKNFWRTAVQESLYILKNVPLIYRQDKEIVLSAIRSNWKLIEFVDESLRNDPDIFLAAIREICNRRGPSDPGSIMELMPENFISDWEFLLNPVEDYPRMFEDEIKVIRSDKEFMLKIFEKIYRWILDYVTPELQSGKQFIVEAAKRNKDILMYLPEHYKLEFIGMLNNEGIESDLISELKRNSDTFGHEQK